MEEDMMIYLQRINVTLVVEMANLLETAPKEGDQIREDIIIVKGDMEVFLEVVAIIIEEYMDLLDLQVKEVKEKALGDLEKEAMVATFFKMEILEHFRR